ncbi:MAG: ketol-acid reductoisomerase [Candidatus Peregrinibacteria bacterium]
MRLLYEDAATPSLLDGKRIAVIGYGAQGRAQALMMHDSGLDVVVGVREGGASWDLVQQDGLRVATISDAAKEGDIIHILIPDEVQGQIYESEIAQHVVPGKTLSFSHGFNIIFKKIVPVEGVDVIMVAPKAPGTEERKVYLQGFGVPALIAVAANYTGKAQEKALALANAMHFTKAGVLECTFEQETYEDLFGEQTVLCGGVVELMKQGFEVLTEAGYPPEMAYFECLHEMKLIIDLVYDGGIEHMYHVVSNTAEYGGRTVGPKVITPATKQAMKEALNRVENGEFAKEYLADFANGFAHLAKLREEGKTHPIEITGQKIRALFTRG